MNAANEKKTSEMNKLLDFMSSFDKLTFGKSFCFAVESFFKDAFNIKLMVAYSLPIDTPATKASEILNTSRIVWNKKQCESQNQQNHVSLIEMLIQKGEEFNWVTNGNDDICFTISKSEKQTVYAVLEAIQCDPVLWDYLVHFFQSQSKRQIKFDEMRRLEHLVHVDDVTGLFNQRKLFKDLDEAIIRYSNHKEGFAVLFIDIDHFKSVNDGHGHLVGTQILVDMANILRACLRETDLIYRYGGDEFVLIIRDVDLELAKTIGYRILNTVKNCHFQAKEKDIHEDAVKTFRLTVSIGISLFPQDAQNREDIIAQADKMMYQAKETGRGKVCLTSELGL